MWSAVCRDVCLSTGETELEASWQGLVESLRQVTSAPGTDERPCVASAWCAIRRRLAHHGIRQPLQLVLDPHVHPAIRLVLETLLPTPYWLEPFLRVLSVSVVDTAGLFPPSLTLGTGCRRWRHISHSNMRYYQACLDQVVTHQLSSGTSTGFLFSTTLSLAAAPHDPWPTNYFRLRGQGLNGSVDCPHSRVGGAWSLPRDVYYVSPKLGPLASPSLTLSQHQGGTCRRWSTHMEPCSDQY